MLIYLQMIETDSDRSKFLEIYDRYAGLMYHVAYKYLRSRQDAEDCVQSAFVKVAENIKKISQPDSPKTKQFVVIITEHKAIDMLRRSGRNAELPLDEAIAGVFPAPMVDDTLASCILRLPPEQREVIWLKYHHGYSLREIAAMLGSTIARVQKLDQRARKKLEEILREEEELC